MSEENTISEDEKIKIAANFLFHSPPGEFKEVFLDLRGLLNDDRILKKSLNSTNAIYNQDQFVQCDLAENTHTHTNSTKNNNEQTPPCLITEFNDLQNGRYYDPRTKQSFKFDHLHFKASEFEAYSSGAESEESEPWRHALEKDLTTYVNVHYKNAACSVIGSSDSGIVSLVCCTEAHKFQPANYWNARWRSRWAIKFKSNSKDTTTVELSGILKVQVHYYEDGNVQLVSHKDIKESVSVTDAQGTAKAICQAIERAENEYQNAISENYQTMSETTFKALRRALPVTRSKIDWNKISSYKIATELKSSSP